MSAKKKKDSIDVNAMIKDMSSKYNIKPDILHNIIILIKNKMVQNKYGTCKLHCELINSGLEVWLYDKDIEGVFGNELHLGELNQFISDIDLNKKLTLPDLSENKRIEKIDFKFDSNDKYIRIFNNFFHILQQFQNMQIQYDTFIPFEKSIIQGEVIQVSHRGNGGDEEIIQAPGENRYELISVNLKLKGIEAAVKVKSINNSFRRGQMINLYLKEVNRANRGDQLKCDILSEEFLFFLMKRYIPELCDHQVREDSVVQVMSIARIPGYKSVVLVKSLNDISNPVSVCIGVNGSRIKAINDNLGKEFLVVLPFVEDGVELVNSLFKSSADILDIRYKEFNKECFYIISKEDNIGKLVGRRHYNTKLAMKILNTEVKVVTEDQYKEIQSDFCFNATEKLKYDLKIDNMTAQTLVYTYKLSDIDLISKESLDEVSEIPDEKKLEILNRVEEVKEERAEDLERESYIKNLLANIFDLDVGIFDILFENDIKEVSDITEDSIKYIKGIYKKDKYYLVDKAKEVNEYLNEFERLLGIDSTICYILFSNGIFTADDITLDKLELIEELAEGDLYKELYERTQSIKNKSL